jgi:hypothetical protein
MPTLSWKILADFDNDATFSYDITAYVQEFSWRLGIRKPYQRIADEATATIKLINTGGLFSPENPVNIAPGMLVPHRRLKIIAVLDSVDTVMWVGWIDTYVIDSQKAGANTGETYASLKCSGAKKLLQDTTIGLELYSDVTADVVIADVLTQAAIPPAVSNVWLLGVPGNSELGVTTWLGELTDFADLETGITVFPTYGDTARPDAYSIIKELIDAEQGYFFFDREGKAVFWNRHHVLLDSDIDATVTLSNTYKPFDWDYIYGEYLANIVRVQPKVRKAAANQTLWSLDYSLTIGVNSTLTFETEALRDEDGQYVSASSLATSGIVFGSGTATISVESLSNRARITITNSSSTTPTNLTALDITGTPLTNRNGQILQVQDDVSVGAYGKNEIKLNLSALDNLNDATNIAAYVLKQRKDPLGMVPFIKYIREANNTDDAHLFAWGIGTRLQVDMDEFFHDGEYFIMGEEHTIREGQQIHECKFFLEPADTQQYWLLGEPGFSELGETTYLAY